MADTRPDPLVPAEVDLTDFAFMPLRIEQLKRSRAWLKAKRRPELAFYMINLWTGSWHERPAASLEPDDDVLADMARCDPVKWDKVKEAALHGWVLCSDGRLYHPIVAEIALEAWKGKVEQRTRTLKARIAAIEKRLSEAATAVDKVHLEGLLLPLRQQLSQIAGTQPPRQSQRSVTDSKGEGQGERKGQGKGEGQGIGDEEAAAAPAPASPNGAAAPPCASDDPGPIPDFLKRAEPEVLPPEGNDVKAAIFGAGLRWLMTNTGASESSCRSFLGQLIGQHGEAKTASALMAAERAKPVDARAWLKRNIEGAHNGPSPRNRPGTIQSGEGAETDGVSAAFARRSVQSG